jgi:hypothetical protein
MPQSVTLVCRSWHPSMHAVSPVAHAQVPALQIWPVGHVLPQVPQLVLLVWRSSHPAVQSVSPVGHAPDSVALSPADALSVAPSPSMVSSASLLAESAAPESGVEESPGTDWSFAASAVTAESPAA